MTAGQRLREILETEGELLEAVAQKVSDFAALEYAEAIFYMDSGAVRLNFWITVHGLEGLVRVFCEKELIFQELYGFNPLEDILIEAIERVRQ